jgi:cysteine synthase B
MVLAAEDAGRVPDAGRSLLDATSGNTGVALAMVGAVRGHAVTLCLPDRVSLERKRIASAFGARLVLTDPVEGTDGAIREARRLAAAEPERFVYLDQYSNEANVTAHERTTGPEVWSQTRGEITHLVAGAGTGGTIVGSSRFLRPKGVRVVAVQPDAPLHGLDGLKHMASSIRPPIWDETAADEQTVVGTDEAHALVRRLAREEGLLAGPSSGAALAAGLRIAAREEALVVVVLPDGGERYLSTPLWES